jgi:hypothetical protein
MVKKNFIPVVNQPFTKPRKNFIIKNKGEEEMLFLFNYLPFSFSPLLPYFFNCR